MFKNIPEGYSDADAAEYPSIEREAFEQCGTLTALIKSIPEGYSDAKAAEYSSIERDDFEQCGTLNRRNILCKITGARSHISIHMNTDNR